jgi:predicted aldo/keto reductase-like oxidoreductase
MDVKNEATEEGMHLAGKKGCALVIMEPLRGGCLASAPKRVQAIYDEYPVKRSAVEWAFRHVLDYPEVSTVLSGMTTLEQLKENVEIFSKPDINPGCVSPAERDIITRVRAAYESVKTVPCTACEYCMPCPRGVNLPGVFGRFNDANMYESFEQPQRSYSFMAGSKSDASSCAACGECEKKCPQHIGIIEELKKAHNALKGWIG